MWVKEVALFWALASNQEIKPPCLHLLVQPLLDSQTAPFLLTAFWLSDVIHNKIFCSEGVKTSSGVMA